MGLRPNLFVGALGLFVFAISLGLIVSNWNGLTDTHVFDAVVQVEEHAFAPKIGEAASGASQQETVTVPYANVTWVRLEVSWTERAGGIGGRSQEVTATLRDPAKKVIGTRTLAAGERVIVIEQEIHPTPESGSYRATGDANGTEAAKRYPSYSETKGDWTITITAQGGTSAIEYRVDLSVRTYTVDIQPRPTPVPR